MASRFRWFLLGRPPWSRAAASLQLRLACRCSRLVSRCGLPVFSRWSSALRLACRSRWSVVLAGSRLVSRSCLPVVSRVGLPLGLYSLSLSLVPAWSPAVVFRLSLEQVIAAARALPNSDANRNFKLIGVHAPVPYCTYVVAPKEKPKDT